MHKQMQLVVRSSILRQINRFHRQSADTTCGRAFSLASIQNPLHNLRFATPSPFCQQHSRNMSSSSSSSSSGSDKLAINDALAPLGMRQLFDEESSTYTYLIWDDTTKDAIIADPVDTKVDRDFQAIQELGLNLKYGINTHAHADHITGTGLLKRRVSGLQSIISKSSGAKADVQVSPGDTIEFGSRSLSVRATPGHTAGCVSYVTDDLRLVLTGDALLIQGCGRTDFQGGSASTLYDSVHTQLFALPNDTVVYPAHDYKSRTSSTIGKEKTTNPRLGDGKSKDEFIEIMANLNLSYPKKMDVAVPANMRCGVPDVE